MNYILTIILIILISYLLSQLSKKIKWPEVVSLILFGLIVSFPEVRNFLIVPNEGLISFLGTMGLFSLMFLAGLESSWKILYKEKKDSVIIAFLSFIVPLILATGVFLLLGLPFSVALIIGVCLSISAEATRAKVLLNLNKLKTKIGSILMGAGIVDDLLGLFSFIIITSFLHQTHITELLLILGVIFFFFIGIVSNHFIKKENKIRVAFEKALLLLLVPFFFVSIGLNFSITSLLVNILLLTVMIATAMSGKFIGAFISKPFTKLNFRKLYLIGWAMNSRGSIEIALALIAFKINIISVEIYSALVITALLTTISFPLAITYLIKKFPKIMN